MEFLRTPDPAARQGLLPTPAGDSDAPSSSGQRQDRHDIRSSFQSLFSPQDTGTAPQTPALASSHSYQFPGLTPFLGAVTPALHAASATGTTPAFGATPFASGPAGSASIFTPHQHAGFALPFQTTQSPRIVGTPIHDVPNLTSPYLQAAAKEAVRREFMSMPSYLASDPSVNRQPLETVSNEKDSDVTDNVTSASNELSSNTTKATGPQLSNPTSPEQTIPGTNLSKRDQYVNQPSQQNQPSSWQQQQQFPMLPYPYNTFPGLMYMPYPGLMPQHPAFQSTAQPFGLLPTAGFPMAPGLSVGSNPNPSVAVNGSQLPDSNGSMKDQKHETSHSTNIETNNSAGNLSGSADSAAGQQQQTQQQQLATSQGMMIMGANGPVLVPPAQFPFGQNSHMMMQQNPAMAAAMAAAVSASNPSTRSESAAQKKERVEIEKQELIREFKKKTREAALVRFRQKRRERRFGKLIRYDCRKKLADARPRIKGRFVRIKDGVDEDEDDDREDDVDDVHELHSPDSSPQVVPDL